jgi:hypothetical protein
MKNDSMAYTKPATVYYLEGEPHFPHYSVRGMYVNGFTKAMMTAQRLIELGAKPKTQQLWPRYWL